MHTRHIVLAVALGVTTALAAAPAASAAINGPCTAKIAQTNVAPLSATDRADAIAVKQHGVAGVTMSSSKPITHLRVQISLAGLHWTVKNGSSHGTSWSKTVNVGHYARWGVGLYQVTGTSTGPGVRCSGTALVKVEGNPLGKPAGIVGAAVFLLGIGGVAASSLAAFRGRTVGPAIRGTISGVGVAFGALVLLQQDGRVYPTGTLVIVSLLIGAVVGAGAPALAHLRTSLHHRAPHGPDAVGPTGA